MKKVVKIEGLDCPNCARALECEINKLKDVESASIDFVHSKLTYECKDEEKAYDEIVKLTKHIEPKAKISKEKAKYKLVDKNFVINIIFLILGIASGLVAILVTLPTWAFWTLFVLSALLLGYQTYLKAIKLLFKGNVNENMLITLSVVGAAVIGEYMESLMVICLYSIGKILEGLAVNKSKRSIEELTNLQPEYANLLVDSKEERVSPEDVELGSTIIVRAGEKVPLDGVILEGSSMLDTQSLTGESLPYSVSKGDEILSGSIVLDGVLTIKTTKTCTESMVSKIMNLIENAENKKSKTETFISKITRWYTLGVFVLSVLVWGIVWAVTKEFNTALYRGLIFLVVSCPCAFAISVPLSYFSGIGNASKKGILIKGSNYLDACAKLDIVAFDKTGTLTTGQFNIEKVESFKDNLTEEDIIYLASLGEQNSLHPLAKSILANNKKELVEVDNVKEIAGEGVFFAFNGKTYFIGRKGKEGKNTSVEVYENEVLIGKIYLSDTIKESSRVACEELNSMGIKTVLLSGDNKEIVESVGNSLGIQECKYSLLPQDKYNWIEENKKGKTLAYVGDGINDAPSLMLADVGISMGINGSPASIEASDIVLVDDNPNKVPMAVKLSKYTRKIVWENIIFSAGIKFTFLLLGAIGITGMLPAVLADVGVTVLAILNSMRALRYTPKK